MHSSRVGVRTSAWTSASPGSVNSIIGSPKAAVLPVPVWAWPIDVAALQQLGDRLLLDRARRLVADVAQRGEQGLGQPEVGEGGHPGRDSRTPLSVDPRGGEAGGRDGAAAGNGFGSARGIEQQLAGRAPRLQVLVRPRRPPRARTPPRRPPAARRVRRAPKRSFSGSPTIAGSRRRCMSQKPTTAWLRRISAPVDTVLRLPRGDPVGDQAPERRERVQRLLEDPPARHLEHDVDLAPLVGLHQRAGQVLGGDVDRRVGAQLERQRALVLGRGGGDHAAGAERAARAGPRASRRRPPRRGRRRTRPSRSWAEVRHRCQAVSPWMTSAPARRRPRTSSGSGEGRRGRAPRRTRRSRPCRPAPPRAGPPRSRAPSRSTTPATSAPGTSGSS